eukprot:GHVS01051220.1.p1 GENE.GHVS01051220.1~~GHVS01051220.1.p1  ORF type:complete len:500 (+),score=48.37 GHVS01051220.1:202-1701(+)
MARVLCFSAYCFKGLFQLLVIIKLVPVFLMLPCIISFLLNSFPPPADAAPLAAIPPTSVGRAPAITGNLFLGKTVRRFPRDNLMFQAGLPSSLPPLSPPIHYGSKKSPCRRWSVVTTIFPPSPAVRLQARLPSWCLVVVGDIKGPATYDIEGEEVVFLDYNKQNAMAERGMSIVRELPWNSFGRKNVGYLYAIQRGAQQLWDFDDDNALFHSNRSSNTSILSISEQLEGSKPIPVRQVNHSSTVLNPYPIMGAPHLPCWPRGYPLDRIKDPRPTTTTDTSVPASSVGIVQSLADHDPDVDALYRLILPLPFRFELPPQSSSSLLLVPPSSFAPLNSQATLFVQPALWTLFLPVSVPGRVSDIWRGYVAQRLLKEVDPPLNVLFSPPLVQQFRNPHNFLGDMRAEDDLYHKVGRLVAFLSSWRPQADSLEGRMEELWVDLYQREYIELSDVRLVQLWLLSLTQLGYSMPRARPVAKYADSCKANHIEWTAPQSRRETDLA